MDGVESNAFSHSSSLLSLSYSSSSFESDNESDAELDASGVLGSEYAAIEPYLYELECSEEEAASDQSSPSGHFQEHRLTNKDW